MIQNIAAIRLIEITIGVFSIYLGYRLFCDIPHDESPASRRRIFTNITSGTLLALFGMGILLTGAMQQPRAVRAHTSRAARSMRSPAIHRFGVAARIA
jgi:hypothetical protein